MIYGLAQSTAEASPQSTRMQRPLSELFASVKFQESRMIDQLDLGSLCGAKPGEEENFLTNLVIEAYLQLIATASLSAKGLNIENLGWEAFEKGFGNKPVEDLLKGEGLLTKQDAVLVL